MLELLLGCGGGRLGGCSCSPVCSIGFQSVLACALSCFMPEMPCSACEAAALLHLSLSGYLRLHSSAWQICLREMRRVSVCILDAGELAGAHLAFPGETLALGFSTGTGSLPILPPSFALTSVALSRSFLGWNGMGGGGSACMRRAGDSLCNSCTERVQQMPASCLCWPHHLPWPWQPCPLLLLTRRAWL